ncbi:MAG: HAMP domain-containing sensor histidine kinase [Pseudomonadota bacterium]
MSEVVAAVPMQAWDAIIAHQLKTPLCAMDADLRTADTVDVVKLREEILRLTKLIDTIQLFARCRDGRTGERETLALGPIVRQAVTALAPLGCDAGLKMVFRDLSCDCRILADPMLVDEAVRNVIENAMKYSPPRGTINVAVMSTGHVCVLDCGPGVSPATGEALFEPFQRGITGKPGSGLGLFLVREIMRHQNGHASLFRRRGGGSAAVLGFQRAAG